MAKVNQTVNEAQLKARRTSLGKKSVDELITIILRKDKSERSMNSKIQELTKANDNLEAANKEQASRILNFDKDIKEIEDIVKVKQETIDNLLSEKHSLIVERNEYCKNTIYLKNLCNFRRKVIFTLFGTIAILIILLFLL